MSNSTLAAVMLVATPLLAFAGSFAGHWLARASAKELDHWRRREETMRLLRWAAELAVSSDSGRALLGVQVVDALPDTELLQPEDLDLIIAVQQAVVGETLDAVDDDTTVETEG